MARDEKECLCLECLVFFLYMFSLIRMKILKRYLILLAISNERTFN